MFYKNIKIARNTYNVRPIGFYCCVLWLFFLMLSCKSKSGQDVDKQVVINRLETEFLGQVGTFNLKSPYLISTRIFRTYNNLSEEFVELIQPKSFFKSVKPTTKFGLEVEILFSKNFRTFVVYQYDEKEQMTYKLVTFTKDFDYIDDIDVSYFDLKTKMNETETYVYKNKLFVHNKNTKQAKAYILNDKGNFVEQTTEISFNYLPLKVFNHKEELLQLYPKRVVRAKNGLIIRDSVGNKIGKFNFLETISILETDKELITVTDNGKTIEGYKAKVIIDVNKLKKSENFNISNPNTGYVFTGFLFNEPTDDTDYKYSGLSINEKSISTINLNELMEIESVNIDSFKSKIVKQTQNIEVTKDYKKQGIVSLVAKNGKKLIYKDTTYENREFSPTKVFSVFEDQEFQNQFIVNYHMIFDYAHFYFIDKNSGDLIDSYFGGYPHVSPNKEIIVSVDYDAECPNQRTLFIEKIINGKIVKVLQIYFDTSENSDINFIETEDKNEIFWLSDTSFILKFWGTTECYDDSNNYFYQKFKLKENLLHLLDIN